MDYEQALLYLSQLGKFGSVPGLERVAGLLEELGHPEQKIKTIHVTGTNGKGSVTAFLSRVLLEAGCTVGTFTSPHFVKYNERITLNGGEVSDAAFAELAQKVAEAESAFKAKGGAQPTQFEVVTAMAFVYFAKMQVDYAVIEVGMGGLYDSTNVLRPEVTIITNVTLDHTSVLGKTVEAISEQKAGIIKNGVPVVTAASGTALSVICAKAQELSAPVYQLGRDFKVEQLAFFYKGQSFNYVEGDNSDPYISHLLGEHQLANAAVAIKALKILAQKDARITQTSLTRGITQTVWPGRLEIIRHNPMVLLDGAHNPSGVSALRRALDQYFPTGKRIFVFGMMADKDIAEVARILFRKEDRVFTVRADDSERAAHPEDLAYAIGANAAACLNVPSAYARALEKSTPEDLICICGSLYLLGTFKAWQEGSLHGKGNL